MTKDDFIVLAERIRSNRTVFTDAAIDAIAQACRLQNSRFNESRWRGQIDGRNTASGRPISPDESE